MVFLGPRPLFFVKEGEGGGRWGTKSGDQFCTDVSLFLADLHRMSVGSKRWSHWFPRRVSEKIPV